MKKLYFTLLALALCLALPAPSSAAMPEADAKTASPAAVYTSGTPKYRDPADPGATPAGDAAVFWAMPTGDAIVVSGGDGADVQTVQPAVYKIDGANYFRLRDIAFLLKGSERQFAVDYDDGAKAVTITSHAPYTATGRELTGTADGKQSAILTNNAILIDGEPASLTVFKIDGENYFRLRDLGMALDFYVGYDAETKTVVISGAEGYEAEDAEVTLVEIVDLTVVNELATPDALEEFYRDSEYTYLFPSIKSAHIECRFSDGGAMTIKEALESGRVSVSDLDTYRIQYWIEDRDGNYTNSLDR